MTTDKVSTDELAKLFPPQDRRRRKRILTLRNTGIFVLAAIALFLTVSVFTEVRRGKPGQFGRLYSRRARVVETNSRQAYTVVKETEISDHTGADPLLLDAARRAQWLGVSDADIARMREAQNPTMGQATSIPAGGELLQQNSNREKSRIEISGGPEGVTIKKENN